MAGLYQAVRMIAVYLLFSSVLLGILQDSPFKHYVRLFTGLMMVLLVVRSFSFISVDMDIDLGRITEQAMDSDDFSARLLEAEEAGKDRLMERILQELQKKAEEFAQENGYELRDVEVELEKDYQIEEMRIELKEEQKTGADMEGKQREEAMKEAEAVGQEANRNSMENDIENLKIKAAESFSIEPEAITIEIS